MKFKSVILATILLVSYTLSIAQKGSGYSLKWGETSKSKIIPKEFIGRDQKGDYLFYSARFHTIPLLFVTLVNEKDYINVYDSKFNLKDFKELDLPKIKATNYTFSKLQDRSAIQVGSDSYIIQQQRDKDNFLIQAWKIDLDKKRLGKATTIGKIGDVKSVRGNSLQFAISPDSSKILAHIEAENYHKNVFGYYFFVFDRSFQKIWSGRGDVPYDDDDYNAQDVTVDNQGFVTVTGRHYIPKKERKKGDPKWEPAILRFTEKGKPERLELKPAGKFVQRTLLSAGKNNQTLAVGFYGNDGFYEQDGLFFSTVDANGNLEGTKTFEFDNEFLTSTMKEKKAERVKKRLDNNEEDESENSFAFQHIKQMADGGFVALGQQYWYTISTSQSGTGVNVTYHTTYSHNYGDIVVAKFSATGDLEWVKKINNHQVISSSSSVKPLEKMYGFMVRGSDVYVVFEDDERNLNNRDNSKFLQARELATVVAHINSKGEVQRSNVEDSSEKGRWHLSYPGVFSVSEGKMIIAAYKGITANKKKFGTLEAK